MHSPKWGIHSSSCSAMVSASEQMLRFHTHNQLRPMTTQTQATDQVLTDEQLEALNGGDFLGVLKYILYSAGSMGVYPVVDAISGAPKLQKAFS